MTKLRGLTSVTTVTQPAGHMLVGELPEWAKKPTRNFVVPSNTTITLVSMRRIVNITRNEDGRELSRTSKVEQDPSSGTITLLVLEGSKAKMLVNKSFFIANVILMKGSQPDKLVQLSFDKSGALRMKNYATPGRAHIVRRPGGELVVAS